MISLFSFLAIYDFLACWVSLVFLLFVEHEKSGKEDTRTDVPLSLSFFSLDVSLHRSIRVLRRILKSTLWVTLFPPLTMTSQSIEGTDSTNLPPLFLLRCPRTDSSPTELGIFASCSCESNLHAHIYLPLFSLTVPSLLQSLNHASRDKVSASRFRLAKSSSPEAPF